jgi:hypothetical protein
MGGGVRFESYFWTELERLERPAGCQIDHPLRGYPTPKVQFK